MRRRQSGDPSVESIGENPMAVRSYEEIAEILFRRDGIRMTKQAVCNVSQRAERKLKRRLSRFMRLST